MVSERQNGRGPVHLGAKLQAFPEEVIRQQRGPIGCTEYLIRWSIVNLENGTGSNLDASSTERKMENVLMWMSADEAYANCPTLLGNRKPKEQQMEEEAPNAFSPNATLDGASLLEMEGDIRNLVQRATWQMASPPVPLPSILNTIHVLSAYASIGSLTSVFKETGALDLLRKLLCSKEKQIRRSAGQVLRALASHDAGSRAYVLLSLSQQDGIEQDMDFESCCTLLELFAETTSSEDHCMSFEGIHLPQIPGKRLFSLVRHYLCVTSLMDKPNSTVELEREHKDFASSYINSGREKRVKLEFDFSMAMASLIAELLQVMGWAHAPKCRSPQERGPRVGQSIFQPHVPTCATVRSTASRPQKEVGTFKARSAFSSRSSYVAYVQETLAHGMRVRMLEDYEKVRVGDEGGFLHSNNGTPPVQVHWETLDRAYWVHWHMIEIVGEQQASFAGTLRPNAVKQTHCKPLWGLYSLPYLSDPVDEKPGTLSRAEWWELLFFIKKLEPHKLQGTVHFIQQNQQLSELDEEGLIQLSVPVELVPKLLQLLREQSQDCLWSCLQNSHIYLKYAFSKGEADQNWQHGDVTPSEATESRKPKKSFAANVPSSAPSTAEKTDIQLTNDLLGVEGLSFPDKLEERAEGSASSFNLKDIDGAALLSRLHESSVSKHMVTALEHCLRAEGACPEGKRHEVLTGMLLNLAQLGGSEEDVQLESLRLLNTLLDRPQDVAVPWHEFIETCLSSMRAHINNLQVVQEYITFLHGLATLSKDCAVLMCCLGTEKTLTKVLEKHSSGLRLVTELRDLIRDCENYANLYKKLTTSILAGCIQLALDQIEEHRRSHQPISVPFLDVFLQHLCQGCRIEVNEDKCWEKVEVSSNPQHASKLSDGNPKTYWESNGSTGSHYINVYMHPGAIVQHMSLLVASEDASYMPARITVMGGESVSSLTTKLNTVSVSPSASRVVLLENLTGFWPILQIRLKCCQQGGIDTRVRGIEVLAPKPTFWPIFKEQLCRRTYLFYTTKAHTWCQEIADDRMQLLQLFNRLNSALHHEQVFADRFLPDDEAAQALGKTCWEALISPLVQSITSPDSSGISPLAWLLSQYLENLEAAQNAKRQKAKCSIFNSRVRRLSHLLVHVDSGSPEPDELKPSVKSNGKNSKNKESNSGTGKAAVKKPNSTTGLMQCWKSVVQQQVKRFLESSWQAPDFVEQYCKVYVDLRTAMEELWGQRRSFRMALCQGFAQPLSELSFPTAMHVSEQFARYIDVWIQKSWADSGNMETLRRLQQSLEPVLFLSGLELANTFEHFYRYYLGDRLLSQGKTWLECAVVEHIGLCFPNRFPQQMLKNLTELEEQQQQFHLFQLQQLDKHLLELNQDKKYEEEEGEIMTEEEEEEEPFCQQEEPEVKVLALSPRCWTISPLCYLEEPAQFFPPSLSQHLSKFADFYTQSQSRFGLEHTKPRRLQWTWLGHAELQYQGCVLHVSTLQMYILLCFNSAEEVSVATLLQATGLSPALLGHALKPLTKEDGILTQNQGVLKRNEEMLAPSSTHCLRLLPKQSYLNAEKGEGSALGRRRNLICCRLLQILKEEKEMHIDNLVFRVIDACQKQDGLSSFSYSGPDVLSCVLHLLSRGSIRRQETKLQHLEYVFSELPPPPALPTSAPQVAFQTVQIKKAPSGVPCSESRQMFSTFRS